MDVTIVNSWKSEDGFLMFEVSNGTWSLLAPRGTAPTDEEVLASLAHFCPDGGPFHIWRSKNLPGVVHARVLIQHKPFTDAD